MAPHSIFETSFLFGIEHCLSNLGICQSRGRPRPRMNLFNMSKLSSNPGSIQLVAELLKRY